MAMLLNRSVLRPVERVGAPGLGFRARWRRRGERRAYYRYIRGADERARQPTGGKGPRITSGGPYSLQRNGQTSVHSILSALARENEQELKERSGGKEGAGWGAGREINAILGFRGVDNCLLCNFEMYTERALFFKLIPNDGSWLRIKFWKEKRKKENFGVCDLTQKFERLEIVVFENLQDDYGVL